MPSATLTIYVSVLLVLLTICINISLPMVENRTKKIRQFKEIKEYSTNILNELKKKIPCENSKNIPSIEGVNYRIPLISRSYKKKVENALDVFSRNEIVNTRLNEIYDSINAVDIIERRYPYGNISQKGFEDIVSEIPPLCNNLSDLTNLDKLDETKSSFGERLVIFLLFVDILLILVTVVAVILLISNGGSDPAINTTIIETRNALNLHIEV